MRLTTVRIDGELRLGFLYEGKILVPNEAWAQQQGMPTTLLDAIRLQSRLDQQLTALLDAYYGADTSDTKDADDSVVTALNSDECEFGPTVPFGRKIICVGLNYRDHADESKLELPKSPILFTKYDNALCGHGSDVTKPEATNKLDYEAELAVVIGKTSKDVPVESALDAVFGYTVGNDVSARDLQFATSQWLPGKGCDGFCPVGPVLVTKDEIENPKDLRISCSVNGEVRQDANTSQMIFPLDYLVSYVSSIMTLEPGDVILTGTPQGVAMGMPEGEQKWLIPGDVVTATIEGIGDLTVTIQ